MPSLGVPAWRVAVKAALKKNGKGACAKFAQLATVRASTGAPAVRTGVFRGFGDAFRDDDDEPSSPAPGANAAREILADLKKPNPVPGGSADD